MPTEDRKTILLIDDDESFLSSVGELLRGRGFEVRSAADGEEGLRSIKSQSADLAIVDLVMPNMNGYEFVQRVRTSADSRKLPIIMCAGASNRSRITELGLDVSDFIDKPVQDERLLEAVEKALGLASSARPQPAAPQPEAEPEDPWLAGTRPDEVEVIKEAAAEAPAALSLDSVSDDSPTVSRVNKIIVKAVQLGASDIHVDPQESRSAVRLRLNGALKTVGWFPPELHARLVARLKIMANLAITERRRPQDGQFRVFIKGKKIEFRVSTVPSTYGEKIVLRVLEQGRLRRDLSELEMSVRDLRCVQTAIQNPHGLILVTGPTGSGKTTTLYTMLSVLNTPDVNILTVEDPVEYRLPGITQVPVNPAIGLTFEPVLRAFLRQDPDILLVGEIRDKETAEIAVKASVTGHLVLSTLHTNSAPATVSRLSHMGLPAYLISASVKLVIAQRLIRVLCSDCKRPAALPDDSVRLLRDSELRRLAQVFSAEGCRACQRTGYRGRMPLFEVMPVQSQELRKMILGSVDPDELSELAVKEGMTTLREAALNAVAAGATSLSEAMRLIVGE
jgi:type IV pilus assembly protein PilB